MFDKFNLKVSKLFKKAELEMVELKHPYVGTEHLLLALLQEDDIALICNKLGLNYQIFKNSLVKILGNNYKKSNVILYTPLLKRVINTALEEASNNKDEVNSKYLFRAILDEGEGVAIRIIFELGIDIEKLYNLLVIKSPKKEKKKLEILDIGKNLKDEINCDDVVVGRDTEIELMIETLIRKNKNNPLLIGDAGVGKTALVEELERRILKGKVPNILKDKVIISLELGSLVAGTKYRGEFEEKLTKIIKELEDNPDIIVFIDEIHGIVNAGGAEGAINASDILKPYLARGKIKIIGATTTQEYNNYILKDKALMRRFEVIKVKEPNLDETINILNQVKESYEKHYDIKVSKENIKDIVNLTAKYVFDRNNPDKSLDMLDSVCAMVSVYNNYIFDTCKITDKIKKLEKKKELFIRKNDFKQATLLHDEINNLKDNDLKNEKVIKRKDIIALLSKKYNIPLLEDKKELLAKIQNNWQDKILGQDEALKKIINVLKSHWISFDKPLCILLTGKTGVGKTYSVKEIAKTLKMPLLRLDMSEYNLDISVNRLLGASAGYVGYNDEAIFNKIKMQPYSVILVDELEKASPAILNLFLQIMDEGFVTNAQGIKIDFKNTLIFMTSNIKENKKIGFMENEIDYNESFNPEFLARFDEIITYNEINEEIVLNYLNKNNIYDANLIKEINYQKYGFREVIKAIKKYKLKVKN